ncbi:MAG: GH3 auxin-responsive promoter family protein [Gammaproteobacteria bacterium]|nr:GH3 auxin-responsive promoter family protein [Gammaproteobacteria bacterium]MDH3971539.1 GH3 auxin-responsive promoter family protein [Gammaproteobacteria bacterium]
MSLAGKLIAFVGKRAAKRFDKACENPGKVQTDLLLDMVRRNTGTEYGKRYDFASINSVADFQRNVPVITYEDIKDDMMRVASGTSNVFTAEDPVMFAQTSGTTGDPKFVPVTPTDRGTAHSDQMRTWLYHAQKAHPGILDHKIVSLVSPAIEGHTDSGLPFGSTSGHIYKNMPWIVQRAYSIPYRAFEIEDYQAKYYTIMRISLEHDVRFLATANPSSIIKLCDKADTHAEQLIRDIHDGSLSKTLDIEPEIRQHLQQKLRPNPKRAQLLQQARERRNGKLLPGDYWPRLGLIGCWKGGTVGHYLNQFDAWFNPDGTKPVPVRDWGYLSSEARGSIPLSDEGSMGVLTIATNFFEFVEVDALEANRNAPESWPFLTADQLETGTEYYIFVTTTSGLYRYDINDIVKVVDYYDRAPQIIFLRKGRGMTNLTGEKVSVNQIINAFQEASKATGAIPEHFKAEADGDNSRYILRAEFASRVDEPTLREFLQALDNTLKHDNIEYKAKRDSTRLGPPVLHLMREGWYERGRRKLAESGKRVFQAKTELLSPVKLETQMVKPELVSIIELNDT